MHSSILRAFVLAMLLTLGVGAMTLLAGPPGMAPADFSAWLADYHEQVAEESEDAPLSAARRAELQNEFAARLDIDNLLPDQIATILSMGFVDPTDPATRRQLLQRLAKYRSDRNADGAAAQAAFAMVNASESNATQMFQRALIHPSLAEAVRDGKAPGFLTTMRDATDARDRKRLGARVGDLADACVSTIDPTVLYEFEALDEVAQDALDEDDLADLRSAMLQAANAVSLREDLPETLGKDGAEFVSSLIQMLAPPSVASGEMAPEIDFLWTSEPGAFKKLSDLRGEIVVLDFWATWCGPCIASFPNFRDLQKRYEGFPVRIVGVTSEQRAVRTRSGVNYASNFDHEVELTQRFAQERNMTWTYAFSEQNVFNADYGVNGIPHVAIVSPDGRLAHNDLHPSRKQDLIDLIDALLAESGMPTP